MTVVSRRGRKPISYWAYRLIFEDPELQPFWVTLVGLREVGYLASSSHDAIRHHIESIRPVVELALDSVTDRLLSSFLAAWQTSRLLAAEREQAIAAGLRQQRARLATSLLQPGLFDRRAERAAAAQNATLDEALDRCTTRLEELGRPGPAAIDRRLALGLVAR